MDKESKTFAKNRFGIPIVMCCASCMYNLGASSDITRICNKGEGVVKHDYLCPDWKMRPSLDNAGKGGGRIKKPKYIEFTNARIDEIEKMNIGLNVKKALVEAIPKEYVKKHGSMYIE